jgi:hypothetical protein
MNNELRGMLDKAVVAYLKMLAYHLPKEEEGKQ